MSEMEEITRKLLGWYGLRPKKDAHHVLNERTAKINGGSGERTNGSPTDSGASLPDGAKPSPTPAAPEAT
jgi:hypothetical protein